MLEVPAARQEILHGEEEPSEPEGSKFEHTLAGSDEFLQYLERALAVSEPDPVKI